MRRIDLERDEELFVRFSGAAGPLQHRCLGLQVRWQPCEGLDVASRRIACRRLKLGKTVQSNHALSNVGEFVRCHGARAGFPIGDSFGERLVHVSDVLPLLVAFGGNDEVSVILMTQLDKWLDA
jgi:hypothetical protein